VEYALKQCTVEKLKNIAALGGASVLLGGFSINGEATVMKRTLHYKVSVSFTWEILDQFGGMLGVEGMGEVFELTQEELPKVVLKVPKGRGVLAGVQAKAIEWMKKDGASTIGECLKGEYISAAVLSAEPLHSAANAGCASCIKQCVKKADKLPNMLPEKMMTEWALGWIEQKLSCLVVRLFGGIANATFSLVKVSGDARIRVDHRPIFKLCVECTWAVKTSNGGKGDAQGTLLVPEFTSEKGAAGSTIDVEITPGKKSTGQLVAAFRQDGVASVRTVLAQFVNEFLLQVGNETSTA